ncbi:hypothetical protein Scep_026616 [Stephania cephalantha]|uniref:Uncharacterized protein n=1 Tax=Stephania cephalantha TaxID=152367 RepID=A0AAP0EQT2_9MAGN
MGGGDGVFIAWRSRRARLVTEEPGSSRRSPLVAEEPDLRERKKEKAKEREKSPGRRRSGGIGSCAARWAGRLGARPGAPPHEAAGGERGGDRARQDQREARRGRPASQEDGGETAARAIAQGRRWWSTRSTGKKQESRHGCGRGAKTAARRRRRDGGAEGAKASSDGFRSGGRLKKVAAKRASSDAAGEQCGRTNATQRARFSSGWIRPRDARTLRQSNATRLRRAAAAVAAMASVTADAELQRGGACRPGRIGNRDDAMEVRFTSPKFDVICMILVN